ncbi:MAG: SDR family oxidoreductase [Bdellovibrionales bacterium]|nr:SDR family oxidoreductase [Bdellovibrionales bacterium]
MSQTILITGASGGFGERTVKILLQQNHKVVASMRGVTGKNKEKAAHLAGLGAKVVELDVTNDESVEKAILNAIREVGNIDVVINNAGVGVLGRQEAFTIEDFRKLFEVNVFGVQRVLRTIIPHFRENGGGTIINVSSLLGRITIPYYGPYNASKWAIEALTENYRTELSSFGIDVCILEPGGFPTTFMDNLIKPSDTSRDSQYVNVEPSPEVFFQNFEQALAANPAQDPQNVAEAISKLVATPKGHRQFRTIVDKMGMGDHIEGYNEGLKQITQGVYGAFGIDHLLKLKN